VDIGFGESCESGGGDDEDVRRSGEEGVASLFERGRGGEGRTKEKTDGRGDGGFERDETNSPFVDLMSEGGGGDDEEDGGSFPVGSFDGKEGEEEREGSEKTRPKVSFDCISNEERYPSTYFPSPVSSLATTSLPLMIPWIRAVWNAVGSTTSGN